MLQSHSHCICGRAPVQKRFYNHALLLLVPTLHLTLALVEIRCYSCISLFLQVHTWHVILASVPVHLILSRVRVRCPDYTSCLRLMHTPHLGMISPSLRSKSDAIVASRTRYWYIPGISCSYQSKSILSLEVALTTSSYTASRSLADPDSMLQFVGHSRHTPVLHRKTCCISLSDYSTLITYRPRIPFFI